MHSASIAIIGAGFAGLTCARELADVPGVHVTLIDRHPYQLFAPLLYQVATGGLPEDDIAYPVRAIVRMPTRPSPTPRPATISWSIGFHRAPPVTMA